METQTTEAAPAKPTADDEAEAREQLSVVSDEVVRLEVAWQEHRLGRALAARAPACEGVQRIREIYGSQLRNPLRPYRRLAVGQILQAARRLLDEPVRVFEARAELQLRGLHDPVGPWHLVGATVGGERGVGLRRAQLRASRAWGVGFRFADPMVRRLYATVLLRWAIHEIGSDLISLSAIDREVRPAFGGKLAAGVGQSFEQLVLDLLNREGTRAEKASLAEDMLEKTDLWFEISPGHRARVQVSLLADRTRHDQKLRRILRREELVIVTPRTLAVALQGPGGESLLGAADRVELQRSAGSGVERLAAFLHDCFLKVMARRCDHPLGPAALLPIEVVRLVHRFVEREAPFAWRARKTRERGEAAERAALAA